MFVLPFQLNETEYCIMICLEDDNMNRIREYDPASVILDKVPMNHLRLKEIIVTCATGDDFSAVTKLLNAKPPHLRQALRLLTRGYRYRQDLGDYDGPFLSALEGKEKPS